MNALVSALEIDLKLALLDRHVRELVVLVTHFWLPGLGCVTEMCSALFCVDGCGGGRFSSRL